MSLSIHHSINDTDLERPRQRPETPPEKPTFRSAQSALLTKELDGENDTDYDINSLTRVSTIWRVKHTILIRQRLWTTAGMLLAFSVFVAFAQIALVPDPAKMRIDRFAKISTFLNVFVGLLLGFFMSSSLHRWYNCADGFLVLFDAIRNMQMQFYALGVEETKSDCCLRYGVLSAWMLDALLHVQHAPDDDRESVKEQVWQTLDHGLGANRSTWVSVTKEELATLKNVNDAPGTIWIWVSCIIGRMAQDGDIPPMASPTYGRLIGLAQNAHDGIRSVRSSVCMQPPYIYVQMLASLVHLNNVINAISFGLTLGVAIGTRIQSYGLAGYLEVTKRGEASRDFQQVLVSFFFSVVGPFIYQALLETGAVIAQPFSSEDGHIPTTKMLRSLEQDLFDGKKIAGGLPPKWTKPDFKGSQAAKK